eukprot:CAMPEP_0177784230 /NCGR_PEP_ID=MMETSP0491_2-20121128/19569_1 /TAXON_ID=63592 /ORGANISM="Tetraselmis chuii, Strain PLY429" /LENGTH=651 /DNA_ID=CAMNT_0019304941 /DNA_START=222 /DNA_END=2178 /DNA_ORIENTATION=-
MAPAVSLRAMGGSSLLSARSRATVRSSSSSSSRHLLTALHLPRPGLVVRSRVQRGATGSSSGNGSAPEEGARKREEEEAKAEASGSGGGGEGKPSDEAKRALPTGGLLGDALKFATTFAKEDARVLKRRNRKRWWKRGSFPKLPVDSIEDVTLAGEPAALWQKMLPLGLIFFCASFNLTILQNLRDAIVVTSSGAEALPFLSSYCVLPASLAFFVPTRLALPSRTVFYAAIAPLLACYVFFVTVLYPAAGVLHPVEAAARAAAALPAGLLGLVKVVENWTFSLFFCSAELWGTVVISLLFWSLANDVCSVDEAKTVYPLMGISANVALVVAGNYIKWVNRGPGAGDVYISLLWLVGTVVAMSGLMCLSKNFIDRKNYYASVQEEKPKKEKKKKSKGSFKESLAVLRGSPKIGSLALLVIGYGVCHRLFEFAWKGQLRILYPSPQVAVLSDVSIATGVTTMALMLGGRFVFQYLGWGAAAAATPVVMLLSGAAFFGLSLAAQFGLDIGIAPVALAAAGVTAGAVTQVFARSAKFSLFDPAKEMVYIEMSKEEKSKGKAAVDLVGSQIGKSGASWITQGLLLTLGSISAALPGTTLVFMGMLAVWLKAVARLQGDLKSYEEEKTAAKAAKAAAAEGGSDAPATESATKLNTPS